MTRARALANDPAIARADQPTASLDRADADLLPSVIVLRGKAPLSLVWAANAVMVALIMVRWRWVPDGLRNSEVCGRAQRRPRPSSI